MSNTDNAATPLIRGRPWAPSKALIVVFGCILIPFSVGLINLNKWLMRAHRFPHAIPLVLIHMVVCTVLALVLRVLQPSLFPSLTDPDTQVEVDMKFWLKGAIPIGLVFTSGLVLGNIAYAHLGIAFIQMIKESNLIWVYILSAIFALEQFTARKSLVVCMAIVGMSLTVTGELDLQVMGFLIQVAAVLSEACRIVLQGKLLQGKKLDPFSYVLITSPVCAALLLIVILVIMSFPHVGHDLALPHMSEVIHWAPWLSASAILAFCLNVSIAVFIKYTGPLSYCMVGLLKDVIAVLVSVRILDEHVSKMQILGFCVQICCVLAWALLKSQPEKFESGILTVIKEALKGPMEQPPKV